MPRPQKPPELRERAIALAAGGGNTAQVARDLALNPRTVQHWVANTDPGTLAQYAAQKRALAQKIVLEQLAERTTELMQDIGAAGMDDKAAKAVQARATALGILDDHFGGRQAPSSGGRFGGNSLLDGWTEGDRVTLERIERVTLQHEPPSELADPQG